MTFDHIYCRKRHMPTVAARLGADALPVRACVRETGRSPYADGDVGG